MYKLKDVARRSSAFIGAVGLLAGVASTALPAFTSADALNPLTRRSLTLSSSSPGWSFTDGSGNSTYAPPNSGANGKQTGNTFAFHNSTANGGIKTMSFQYCTHSAGKCWSPGDDATPGTDTTSTSDLNYHINSPSEVGSGSFATVMSNTTVSSNPNGDVSAVPGVTNPLNPSDSTGQYAAHAVSGNFIVMYDNAGTWTQSTGWTLTAQNVEDPTSGPDTHRGTNNYLILTKSSVLNLPFDTAVKVLFFGTTNNYLTNPGSGAFFVKINTYNKEYNASPTGSQVDITGLEPAADTNVIDGGVTVANVMNQSIQITTKVLETMDFSVGTVDPDVLSTADGSSSPQTPSTYENAENIPLGTGTTLHGPCDGILMGMTPSESQNVLQLGNQNAESSLETTHTYTTHSYWRLSSNSSAGATVYYSGHTLSNTEGDQITPIGASKQAPHHGSEQFGLALDNTGTLGTNDTANAVDYSQEANYENGDDNALTSLATFHSDMTTTGDTFHDPQLAPLTPTTNYGMGTGAIDSSPTTQFAFDPNSDTIPAALATESSSVVDCVTGKMRYVANIAATTPAGIYTTKVNYIAAPQY
ncbi:MAG TPA: hypothetical protein VLG92_02360 [Candidatus Saccharimonadia bacterium]|nr:hypothetical protein [Candidatus Saccharimonadia bacterium]